MSDMVNIKVRCGSCQSTSTLSVNPADLDAWYGGTLIQRAFPYLTADERELLISNTCGKCWDSMFLPE